MKLFTQFKQAVERAFTCDHLAYALREHTEAFREHTQALREHSAVLLTKASTLDSIEQHVGYLAISEKHSLRRAGQPHVFK